MRSRNTRLLNAPFSMVSSMHLAVVAALFLSLLVVPSASFAGKKKPKSITRVRAKKLPSFPVDKTVEAEIDERRAIGLGLVPVPEFEGYMQSIADRLIAAAEVGELKVYPHLVTDIGYGAEVAPAGNIYIDARMIDEIEDEDTMAGILAHEIAHLMLGHPKRNQNQKRQENLLVLTEMTISANREVASQYGKKKVLNDENTGRDYQDLAYRLNRDLITPGWGKKHEIAADRLAIDLLSVAGYDPFALTVYLGNLVDRWDDSRGMLNQLDTARADLLKSTMTDLAPSAPTTGNVFGDLAVGHVRNKVEGRVAKSLASISSTHPKPAVRMKKADNYLMAHYADALVDRDSESWMAAISQPSTQAVFKNYRAAFEVEAGLGVKDDAELEALARQAVRPPTSQHPFTRRIFYDLRVRQGEPAKARANLEKALGGPEPSGAITKVYVQRYLIESDPEEALRVAWKQWDRVNQAPALYPLMIRLNLLSGQPEQASEVLALCGTTAVLGEACKRTAEEVMLELQMRQDVAAGPPSMKSAQPASLQTQQASPQAAKPEEAIDEAFSQLGRSLGFGKKKNKNKTK